MSVDTSRIVQRDTRPTSGRLALILIAATALSYPIGVASGFRLLLPLLNAAPAWVVMLMLLGRGERAAAVRLMLLWAVALAVFGTITFVCWPAPMDALVWHGPAYRDEMLHWVHTGEGREGSLALFLPQHLLHLAVFVLLSLATASALSIFMGAVLMNTMAFYVAALGHAGAPAWVVVLLGWQPWALCRIAAFCVLGAILAEPLVSRVASSLKKSRLGTLRGEGPAACKMSLNGSGKPRALPAGPTGGGVGDASPGPPPAVWRPSLHANFSVTTLASRIRRSVYGGLTEARVYLYTAAALILADWVLKAALAPTWRAMLRHAMMP